MELSSKESTFEEQTTWKCPLQWVSDKVAVALHYGVEGAVQRIVKHCKCFLQGFFCEIKISNQSNRGCKDAPGVVAVQFIDCGSTVHSIQLGKLGI